MLSVLIVICFQDTVEILLRHQADINARDKNWQTPLHVAAANNAVKCANYIIPLLSSVNVSDRAGRTSLHHAAFNGHLEVKNLRDVVNAICDIILQILVIGKSDKFCLSVITSNCSRLFSGHVQMSSILTQ